MLISPSTQQEEISVPEKITFNREALGVVEKNQWHDAESLGQIGASVGRISSSDAAYPLPDGDSQGILKLLAAIDALDKAMMWVIQECSDAAANLGSGVATASNNFDQTEHYNRERAAKLGVEWNK